MVCGKVRDHGLIQVLFDHESYHTEGNWVQRITCFADVVKMDLLGKPTIFLRLLANTVCKASGEAIAEKRIKFRRVRQLEC